MCGSLLAAGLAGSARAADAGLPSLIVAPFTGDMTHIAYWQPAMGEGLCEMLITELGKLNKFQVLESTQLGALKDEIKMGEDGWVDQAEKVDKGGFAAADFMQFDRSIGEPLQYFEDFVAFVALIFVKRHR